MPAFFLFSCLDKKVQILPKIGNYQIEGNDTLYHKIPHFEFLSQDSNLISSQTLSRSIYVADFFYSYCPSVCPRVKSQMLRIHDKFNNEEKLKLISFALDPKRDDVENLNSYAHKLGVDNSRWHFLTGNKDEIWSLAEEFLITVRDDPEEPGGIYHSGKIILIDSDGHIRGFANGTEEDDVNDLMKDIKSLLVEYQE